MPVDHAALSHRLAHELAQLRTLCEGVAQDLEAQALQRPAEAAWLLARAQRIRQRLYQLGREEPQGPPA